MSVHEAERRLAKSQAKHDLALAMHEICDSCELTEVEQLEVLTEAFADQIDIVRKGIEHNYVKKDAR